MSDLNPPAGSDLGISKQTTKNYARYVFWVMFLISFLNYMDRYILNGAANVVAHELGFGIDGIGYIASAFLVVYTLATVPLGIWADRAKRKDVVAISVAIWSVATAFTALANSFITLFISRMVLGIGEAGYFPAGTALMSDYFSRVFRASSWHFLPGNCASRAATRRTKRKYPSTRSPWATWPKSRSHTRQ